MAADYTRGEMDIHGQRSTFSAFIRMTIWGGGFTGLAVLFLSLYFAAGLGFWAALIPTTITGVLIGLALRMKAAWYVAIIGLSALIVVAGGLAALAEAVLQG